MRYFLNFLTIFSLLLICIGCSSNSENLTISGTVKGLKKGTLYLQKFQDTTLVTLDSLVADGNSDFTFYQHLDEPEIFYLYVQPKDASLKDDRIAFFAEEGTLDIQTNLKHFGSGARVSGSANDSILRNYDKIKQRYIDRNLELIEKRLNPNSRKSDSVLAANDRDQQRLLSNLYITTVNFAINHKNYEVAPYLILSETPYANVKYLDTVYNSLDSKIKNSKYGKELESLIRLRKENDSL